MDTEKCRVLLCALEQGSLTAAAREMGYTPSGVSRLVAALEQELGVSLLLRGQGGIRPTANCETLLPEFRELVRCSDRCAALASRMRGLETGQITVGSAYHVYNRLLAQITADFGRRYPGIRVRIIEGTSTHLAEQVERGTVDFAVISRREGAFRWELLREDPLVVWVPREEPARTAFPQAELEGVPFIELYPGEETDNSRFLSGLGIRPDVRCSTADVHTACEMVGAGLGVALMNGLLEPEPDSGVTKIPLEPPEPVEIGIARPPAERISPAALRFSEFASRRIRSGEE